MKLEPSTKPFIETTGLDYSINVLLNNDAVKLARSIQRQLSHSLPDKLWLMPAPAIHITIMDWISFFKQYSQDKKRLFEDFFQEYNSVLINLLSRYRDGIEIEFNELRATPDAVILIGKDDGSIANIRSEFTSRVNLLSVTNRPLSIIHSSIVRYKDEFPLTEIESVLPSFKLVKMKVTELHLHKFTIAPVKELKLIKTYALGSGS